MRAMLFLQSTNPGIKTFVLQNGTFAVPSGEVIYTFTCKEVVAYPLNYKDCYMALPVASSEDLVSGHLPSTPSLFLEPLTRRLTAEGIPTPCSSAFPPRYETADGHYITATPSIAVAPTPHRADMSWALGDAASPWETDPVLAETDFSRGGLYSIEDLQDMQYYMEIPRARQALTVRLSEQAVLSVPKGQPLEPRHIFPTLIPDFGFATPFFKAVHEFVLTYGSVIAFCIGVKTILLFLWSTISAALTGRLVWRREGFRQALYQCCLPRHWQVRRLAPVPRPSSSDAPVIMAPPTPPHRTPPLIGRVYDTDDAGFASMPPLAARRIRHHSLPRLTAPRHLTPTTQDSPLVDPATINQLRLINDCATNPCTNPGRCLAHTSIRVDPSVSLV